MPPSTGERREKETHIWSAAKAVGRSRGCRRLAVTLAGVWRRHHERQQVATARPRARPKGGTLNYLTNRPTEHLDPQRTYIGRDISNMGRLVYRGLVTYPITHGHQEGHHPGPRPGHRHRHSPARTPRPGRSRSRTASKWQDGKPITCEDLKYGVSRDVRDRRDHRWPELHPRLPRHPEGADGLPVYKGPYTEDAARPTSTRPSPATATTITYRFKKPWPDFPLAIAVAALVDPYRAGPGQGRQVQLRDLLRRPLQARGQVERRTRAAPSSATPSGTPRGPTTPQGATRTRSCSPRV